MFSGDSSMLNGQSRGKYLTINECSNNLKRPFESEDEVVNNKIRPVEVDFDSYMSRLDVVLEPPTVSSDTDRMNLTENDMYDSVNIIEVQSPNVDSQEIETINLVTDSDSEESDLLETLESQSESSESSDSSESFESTESNIDNSTDDALLHKLPDELLNNTIVDLKHECYKIYPQLLDIVNKEDLIFNVRKLLYLH